MTATHVCIRCFKQVLPITPENKTCPDVGAKGHAWDPTPDSLKLPQEKDCFSGACPSIQFSVELSKIHASLIG